MPHEERDRIPELRAPEGRRPPFRIASEQFVRQRLFSGIGPQVQDDVRVDDDHIRPWRLKRLISSSVVLIFTADRKRSTRSRNSSTAIGFGHTASSNVATISD